MRIVVFYQQNLRQAKNELRGERGCKGEIMLRILGFIKHMIWDKDSWNFGAIGAENR